MTTRKPPATLPPITAQQLLRLREDKNNPQDFYAYVLALRSHGWPLRALAEVTGVSRVAVSKWQIKAEADPTTVTNAKTLILPRVPPTTHGTKTKIKRLRYELTPEQSAELKSLSEQARLVQRWTRKDDPIRDVAARYESLLHFYAEDKKVSVSSLARHTGLTRRAISQRLEKTPAPTSRPVE